MIQFATFARCFFFRKCYPLQRDSIIFELNPLPRLHVRVCLDDLSQYKDSHLVNFIYWSNHVEPQVTLHLPPHLYGLNLQTVR